MKFCGTAKFTASCITSHGKFSNGCEHFTLGWTKPLNSNFFEKWDLISGLKLVLLAISLLHED